MKRYIIRILPGNWQNNITSKGEIMQSNSGLGTILFRILVLVYIAIFSLACKRISIREEKPNIILIYADDLGLGLPGCEGQEIISTPNIDRLAKEGIRYTNAYSCMLCAPARASLISGRHDCHSEPFEITSAGIYKKISSGEYSYKVVDSLVNSRLSPVPEEQVFLGQVAKEAGYVTAQYGKLEWGFATTHNQMIRHGWDNYFGYFDHVRAHGFYPPFLFSNGKLVELPGNTFVDCGKSLEPETEEAYRERWDMNGKSIYSQHIIMDSLLAFIECNSKKPFFIYFPTQLPHGPVSIPKTHPDFENDSRLTQIEKEYASMVKMLDNDVGRINKKLEELNLADKTIIIFTSDNGHEIYYSMEGRIHKPYENMVTGEVFDNVTNKYYSDAGGDIFDGNGGLAGLKRSNLEGGIRVPLLISWPGNINPGTESNTLVANYDLLATIADITGFKGEIQSDGKSFLASIKGYSETDTHKYIVFSSFLGPTLVTADGWKIRACLKSGVFDLYYLPEDKREENDLSADYPAKLSELKNLLLKACEGDLYNGLYSGKNQIRIQ